MQERFKAYSGSEPFIFVSYAHADSDRVYPIITRLHEEGYRIWYDEGIPPTEAWRAVINEHIFKSAVFMIFATRSSMQSREVIGECTFAINLNKKLHIIYLEDIPNELIDYGILAHFVNNQRLNRHQSFADEFERKLREPLTACKGAAVSYACRMCGVKLDLNSASCPVCLTPNPYYSAPAPVQDEQLYNVVLTQRGPNALMVIKITRGLLALGLAETKDLVENLPATVKTGVSRSDAEAIVREYAEVGAAAEIRRSV